MNLSTPEAAKTEIKEVLAQSPRQYGLSPVRWTLETIREAVPWLRGYTVPGVWQLMQRLGLRYKQAADFIRSPDPFFKLKVRDMKQAFAQAIFRPQEAVILFQDELSFYQSPSLAPAWGEGGSHQPTVFKTPGRNQLTRIGAVMDGVTGALLYQQGNKFGIQHMRQLYHQVRDRYDQPHVYVVQDNCPSVHKHPTVLECAEQLDITPLFLPTYASWLNPIERLWRWLKTDVLHNHPWSHCLARLRREVASFLDPFCQPSNDLLRYVGLLPD